MAGQVGKSLAKRTTLALLFLVISPEGIVKPNSQQLLNGLKYFDNIW